MTAWLSKIFQGHLGHEVKIKFSVLRGLNNQQDREQSPAVPSAKLLATWQAELEGTRPLAGVTSMS